MSDTRKTAAIVILIAGSLASLWAFARSASHKSQMKTRTRPLTLRISNIPKDVTKSDFEKILKGLAAEMNASSSASSDLGILGWSFAASGHSEQSCIATVTFHTSPAPTQLQMAIKRSIDVDWGRLRVDLDFFGFTPLADPSDPVVDIIAVTGLSGHAYGSWNSRDGSHMWLRDSLPESIPNARILSYGYDTKLPGSQSTASILDLSKKLLESVRTVRNQREKYRPIIFIGHSLGGLVVKQALVEAAEGSLDDIAVFMSCYAIVFFGVPNQGLENPSLASMVKGQPNEDLIRNLGPSSAFLDLLHKTFYSHFTFDDSQIVCFYETKETATIIWSETIRRWERTGPRVMMVPKASAIHAGKSEQVYNHLPIDEDHSDMVKFSDPSDPNYIVVKERIRQLADNAPGIIRERIIGHKKKLSDKEAKYVRALNAPNYAAVRDKVEDPVPGTFLWVLQDESVRSWLSETESSLLWIRGSPGQGKTVLSKFLLNHLDMCPPNSLSDAEVIYFFCYDQDERLRTATSILRSLIKQLLTTSSSLSHHMSDIFDTGSFSADSEDSLWDILQSMFSDSSLCTIYCVVDALDECDEESRKRLLGRFARLVQASAQKRKRAPTLKLLITSRPIMDIASELNRFPCIDLKANPDDLKLVIERNVQDLRSFSPDLQEKTVELLLAGAGQTFLWVSIVLKKLRAMTLPSPASIREIIKASPKDLNKLYQSIVDRVMEGRVEEQKLLTWVVYSQRPLTLKELEAALATQMNSKTKASTDEHRINLSVEAITSAAGVILHIIDNKVHLIHQSAKDFLVRSQQLKFAEFCDCRDPNIYLAKVCIIYLSLEDFEIGPCVDRKALAARKSQYPLLHYAARNWHTHIRTREDAEAVSYILDRLIKPRSPILLAWAEAADIPDLHEAKDTWGIATKASIAWLTEFQPSSTITEEMVKEAAENRATGHEVMKKHASGSDTVFAIEAVHEIARNFDGEITRLLLVRNDCIPITPSLLKAAAANRKYGDSVIRSLLGLSKDIELTADLVEVAAKNNESGKDIIELLLHRKDIKIADGVGEVLVKYFDAPVVNLLPEGQGFKVTEEVVETAARKKDRGKEVIRTLLGREDICLSEGAVAAIARQFNTEVVELLLRRSDTKIGERTAITIARRFDAKIMRLLLEEKGQIEITEAVVKASAVNKNNGKEVMELLLNSTRTRVADGAVTAVARYFDPEMMGPLINKSGIQITKAVVKAAAVNTGSSKEAVEFLLSRGDVQIVETVMKAAPSDTKRREALSRLAGNGHKVLVKRLLEQLGVHPDTRDRRGWTPLSRAAQNGQLEVVEVLLTANANVNAAAARNGGRTALQAAAGGGHLEIVERLLIANADANAATASRGGETALRAAAGGGHLEVIDRLLAADANVNDAAAALQAAARGGHLEVVDRLLAVNANVNTTDSNNQTALQAAAEGGHLEVVNRLLAANANVNAVASWGSSRTALQAAAGGGHLEVVDKLLAANANVNAVAAGWGGNGRTALQAAAEGGHLEVVDRLLAVNANVNAAAAEGSGRTALQAAAGGGHLEVVDRLLATNANVNAVAAGWSNGQTALQAAAEGGHLEVVDRLLAANANANAAAGKGGGRTALQAAAGGGHLEVVNRLLKANAKVNAAASESNGRTALQAAAEGGHLEVVDRLLAANTDINAAAAADRDGRTALQAAAGGGYLEVVDRLLAANADINTAAVGRNGRTALQAAAGGGYLEVVDRLLAANANVNAVAAGWGENGRTALQAAAEGGHLEVVDRLLAAKADTNAAAAKSDGRTALQAAAEGGYLEVVNKLLAVNADINAAAIEDNGRTALQAAAEGGHLEVVNRLLAVNADINAVAAKNDGRTALQAAASRGYLEVVDRLLAANADINALAAKSGGRTALQAAVDEGHLEVVDRLLAANPDVNAAASEIGGRTALQAAAEGGHLEVVDKLLAANAKVNAAAAESDGQTALQAAAERGHLEIVDRLLAANADVNAPAADYGWTALQAAAQGGHLEVVDRLLAANADVNAVVTKSEDRTALRAAASRGHFEVVDRLLAANADANDGAAEEHSWTALQSAAHGGHLDIVDRLLAANADVNAAPVAMFGRTALQAAAEGGHLGIIDRLLAANADINAAAADGHGWTALQAAASRGHLDVVDRLLAANADVNATPAADYGRTALQVAAEEGHLEAVDRLLAANADVNAAAATYGLTALQAAAGRGHLEVVDRLLAANADFTATSTSGRTALRMAADEGHDEVVERLKLALNHPAPPP